MDSAKYKCEQPAGHIVIPSLKPLAEMVWDAFNHIFCIGNADVSYCISNRCPFYTVIALYGQSPFFYASFAFSRRSKQWQNHSAPVCAFRQHGSIAESKEAWQECHIRAQTHQTNVEELACLGQKVAHEHTKRKANKHICSATA